MIPTVLYDIVRRVESYAEVTRVWLFGSRARGDAGPRSDIDLAIEAPGASRPRWLALEADIEDSDTLLHIDLVRWDEASEGLRERILAEGEVLYDRSQVAGQPAQPRERDRAAA